MQKRIMIIVNAVINNCGSAALINGMLKALKKSDSACRITLVSSEPDFEIRANIPNADKYVNKYSVNEKRTLLYYLWILCKRLGLTQLAYSLRHRHVLIESKKCDVIFVIGADNYDKSYGLLKKFHILNILLKKYSKAKLILFDCSIDKKDIDSDLIDDIKLFDVITVRESVSFENIKELCEETHVYCHPDPAFILSPKECKLPDGWLPDKMIGLNLSNLIVRDKYGCNKEMIMNAYSELIQYILDSTAYSIVLIPHVMNNADLSVLRALYKNFNTDRILIIDDETVTASMLKYIISNCKMFVCARTHASIAAYSSCVPTLVLGYSVKSKGIAVDLFDTTENYVIPVNEITSEKVLIDGFIWLMANKDNIENHLSRIIPEYTSKAWEIGRLLC